MPLKIDDEKFVADIQQLLYGLLNYITIYIYIYIPPPPIECIESAGENAGV